MHNHWTFTEFDNKEWVNEVFYSKLDAISEGRKVYKDEIFIVGQLNKKSDGNYDIINEEVIYSRVNYL